MKEPWEYWKGCCERAQMGDVLQYVMMEGLSEETTFTLNVTKCEKELCVEAEKTTHAEVLLEERAWMFKKQIVGQLGWSWDRQGPDCAVIW